MIFAVGPLIVAATVILPAIVAAVFNWLKARKGYILTADEPATSSGERAADHAYSALILPLGELVRRIGWGVIIVLGLILSYRITDNIWGSFAFPFYLQELQYTGDEVAFASKIFGVFMTMAGIAIRPSLPTVSRSAAITESGPPSIVPKAAIPAWKKTASPRSSPASRRAAATASRPTRTGRTRSRTRWRALR